MPLPELIHELKTALRQRGFETLSEEPGPQRLVLVGRVHPTHTQSWQLVLRHLLFTAKRNSRWSIDLSRKYVLLGDDERLAYAVRIILTSTELEADMRHVSACIQGAPRPARPELTSIPLHVNPNRNVLPGGGGAMATDGSPVPPIKRR